MLGLMLVAIRGAARRRQRPLDSHHRRGLLRDGPRSRRREKSLTVLQAALDLYVKP